jgi:hypothetical protein
MILLESLWMKTFMKQIEDAKDVTKIFLGGIVPLFIQWLDCFIDGGTDTTLDSKLITDLQSILNPNIL